MTVADILDTVMVNERVKDMILALGPVMFKIVVAFSGLLAVQVALSWFGAIGGDAGSLDESSVDYGARLAERDMHDRDMREVRSAMRDNGFSEEEIRERFK